MEKGQKKILLLANTARFFVMFEKNNIQILQSMGYEVHCASNFARERDVDAKTILSKQGVIVHHIDIARSPFSLQNYKAYLQVKKLMQEERFNAVHCHTPMGGVLGRLAARKTKIAPVIYTAHGFHFYKGCPIQNRLIYETIERWLARYTDAIITINEEDYVAAKTFHVRGKVYKIPGVGVDVEKIQNTTVDRSAKRKEIGIPEDAFVMISVGDLIPRKNHITVIRALKKITAKNIYYVICGSGQLDTYLKEEVKKLGIQSKVIFTGFRSDVIELMYAADLFCFPSLQEGLPVALMEAMTVGLPCIASNIRGNNDLIQNNVNGYLVSLDTDNGYENAIESACCAGDKLKQLSLNAKMKMASQYSKEVVMDEMRKVYLSIME